MKATAYATVQDALSEADIIVTSVTISPGLKPFIGAQWLKPGAFVTMTDLAVSALAYRCACDSSLGQLVEL
ncbi:hypothetical protein [Nitrosomonas sp. Nm51]|uniref:hypothetical protein n=1 Tax=Nitrosomonas sp. Nm51 TaxID=133720 RepID=UPI000B8950D6|nr:hypothetical protein [Nitrosomonas sp. Nm51]